MKRWCAQYLWNKAQDFRQVNLYYVHTKVNLFGFITEYNEILRFKRIAFPLDILKFIWIEVKFWWIR